MNRFIKSLKKKRLVKSVPNEERLMSRTQFFVKNVEMRS